MQTFDMRPVIVLNIVRGLDFPKWPVCTDYRTPCTSLLKVKRIDFTLSSINHSIADKSIFEISAIYLSVKPKLRFGGYSKYFDLSMPD